MLLSLTSVSGCKGELKQNIIAGVVVMIARSGPPNALHIRKTLPAAPGKPYRLFHRPRPALPSPVS